MRARELYGIEVSQCQSKRKESTAPASPPPPKRTSERSPVPRSVIASTERVNNHSRGIESTSAEATATLEPSTREESVEEVSTAPRTTRSDIEVAINKSLSDEMQKYLISNDLGEYSTDSLTSMKKK